MISIAIPQKCRYHSRVYVQSQNDKLTFRAIWLL